MFATIAEMFGFATSSDEQGHLHGAQQAKHKTPEERVAQRVGKDVFQEIKQLIAQGDPTLLNELDQGQMTALGRAVVLPMRVNSSLREPWASRSESTANTSRVPEGETDEQRQRREIQEERQRKQKEEQAARSAAEDAVVEELVIALLDAGASPFVLQQYNNWRWFDNQPNVSLLEICARAQLWKQMEILLEHPASSSGRSEDFVGPLVIALVANAPLRCVEMLLDRVDSVLETFVFQKVKPEPGFRERNKEKEDESEPACHVVKPSWGYSLTYRVMTGMSILTSAAASRMENLKAVLERVDQEKVSINAFDGNGNTLLSTLLTEVPKQYEERLQMLLEAGADPSIKTGPKAVDSLMLASGRTRLSRGRTMYSGSGTNDFVTQIEFFARHRKPGVVELLRDRGLRFTEKDADGRTAFHYACHSGSTQLVEWYLDAFTEEETEEIINLALPETGITPAMLLFSLRGTEALVTKFAAAGADLSAVATNGHTALSLAVAARASIDVVEALLANGADPNEGVHPLIAATKQNPRDWKLINTLVDDLDINPTVAQEALNQLFVRFHKSNDPYGDFRVEVGCVVHPREIQERYEKLNREMQSVADKLVDVGANRELARGFARTWTPTDEELVEVLFRRILP